MQNFKMFKETIFYISKKLNLYVKKQNTRICLGIKVEIKMSCAIYKLAQGSNYLICNKLFVVGWLTMSLMIHEVIKVINLVLETLFCGNRCKVVNNHGKIQVMVMWTSKYWWSNRWIHITKPLGPFVQNDYFHKTRSYIMVA
jgi:hypothetical protein